MGEAKRRRYAARGTKTDIAWGQQNPQSRGVATSDATWNAITGCTKISAGCDHCFAEVFAEQFRGTEEFPNGFDLMLRPDKLRAPLEWEEPRLIFVNPLSDVFHKDVPTAFVDQMFAVMEQADWHVYQVLTKRSSLMRNYINARYVSHPLPQHIWLGVSVETVQAKSRITHLQDTHASVRFLSLEPLLESLGHLDLTDIDWVITQPETGPNRRPMDMVWVEEIMEQCIAADVDLFYMPGMNDDGTPCTNMPRVPDDREWERARSTRHIGVTMPTGETFSEVAHDMSHK